MKQRKKILIADDSELNRSLLADMLSDEYEIVEAGSGQEAIALLARFASELALALLDLVMPDMDGLAVLAAMKKSGQIQRVPVIMIAAGSASAYVDHAYDLGAAEVISRPFQEKIVKRRVHHAIALCAKQKTLEATVMAQLAEIEKSNLVMMEIFSHLIAFRQAEGGGHVLHIRVITKALLKQLALLTDQYDLSPRKIALISNASALHDVGKICIPDAILCKPGKLTGEERTVMQTHSALGAGMLERSPYFQTEELVQVARDICRWHHERYDGGGYPDRLAGDEIPISAQAVALADAYDALTSARIYSAPDSHETALHKILNGECGVFNPLLLQCFVEIWPCFTREIRGCSVSEISQTELREKTRHLMQSGGASSRTLALLEQERTKYQFFASMSKEIQFEYYYQSDVLTLSEWGASMLGVSEVVPRPKENKELLGLMNPEDFHDLQMRLHKAKPDSPIVSKIFRLHMHGSGRWYKIVARPLWGLEETDEMTGIIGKVMDVHEEQMELIRLKQIARYDSLTGLYNHAYARKEIEDKLAAGLKEKRQYALLIFDLDFFKLANDRYGHLFGDQVLEAVARHLRNGIRSHDISARIGGDEFLVFMQYLDDIQPLVDRVFRAVSGQYRNFDIAISMGIALAPEHGTGYAELFHRADQALYAAKQNGRKHYCLYQESMEGLLSALSPVEEWQRDPAAK